MEDYYLRIGKASDLKNSKDRVVFRLLEIFPGVLSWGTLILSVILSWKKPVLVAIFIIMKIATKTGFFQERITDKIKVPQERTPGKISNKRKTTRSFEFFK